MTLTHMTRYSNSSRISKWMKSIAFAGVLVIAGWAIAFAAPNTPTAGVNVRVTLDNGSSGAYMSADQLAGGTYTDAVLQRCGTDRRQQNEPTLAIDPRNTSIWASGANEYCTTPTAGDAWAGFYRSTDSGHHWTDSLLPGYNGDTSSEGTSSPLAQLVAGGALAAGDPAMGWDGNGNLFYMATTSTAVSKTASRRAFAIIPASSGWQPMLLRIRRTLRRTARSMFAR